MGLVAAEHSPELDLDFREKHEGFLASGFSRFLASSEMLLPGRTPLRLISTP
jgi:hypothetical protein